MTNAENHTAKSVVEWPRLFNSRHWIIFCIYNVYNQNYRYCTANTENGSKVSPVKPYVTTETTMIELKLNWKTNQTVCIKKVRSSCYSKYFDWLVNWGTLTPWYHANWFGNIIINLLLIQIQSGAVITRSNITWYMYCIHHCSDWSKV